MAIQKGVQGDNPDQGYVKVLQPDPVSVATMSDLRHREVLTISTRLGRMASPSKVNRYGWAGSILIGAVLGGGFGLIPFFSQTPRPSQLAQVIYLGLLAFALIL